MSAGEIVTDHDAVRAWAEEVGAHPARNQATGALGFVWEDTAQDHEPVAWEAFFAQFERDRLALLHAAEAARTSRYFKLVRRAS
jgi:hypothetical protein